MVLSRASRIWLSSKQSEWDFEPAQLQLTIIHLTMVADAQAMCTAMLIEL